MNNIDLENGAPAQCADGTVDEPQRHWFVAFVGHNAEKSCRDRLIQAGYEAFVASQQEVHFWRNGKRKMIEVVIITNYVFVRATEMERRQIVNFPYIKSFMVNKSASLTENGFRTIATIPDNEMEMLKYMLHRAEYPVQFLTHFAKGDKVKVVRGTMTGVEGHIVEMKDSTDKYIGINIGSLGCAVVYISPKDVVKSIKSTPQRAV